MQKLAATTTATVFICLTVLLAGCMRNTVPANDTAGALTGTFSIELTNNFYKILKGVHDSNIWLTLTNKDTGKTVKTSTSDGFYVFYNLEPGDYELTNYRYEHNRSWVQGEDDNYLGTTITIPAKGIVAAESVHVTIQIRPKVTGGAIPFDGETVERKPADTEALKARFARDDAEDSWSGRVWQP